jgi:hypothetical protein
LIIGRDSLNPMIDEVWRALEAPQIYRFANPKPRNELSRVHAASLTEEDANCEEDANHLCAERETQSGV